MAVDPTRPDSRTTLAKLVGVLIVAGILAAGVALPYIGGLGLFAEKAANKFLNTACNWHDTTPPQRSTVYARDGKTVIATLFSQDRVPISLSQVPQALQDALIATEDRRFYQHHGVDLRGLIRSAISTGTGDTQGGSTLTMQYVKQVRYYQAGDDPKKQAAAIAVNLHRKMEDAKCALYIEGTLHRSKSRILQDYLNIAFFGEHAYGIQTAAETYFNKPASKLTLAESAMLVGLLRAPSAYDPFVYPAAAKARRDEVLQNLVAVGKLSQAAADKVERQPISLATTAPPQVRQGCANANSRIPNAAFFCDYVVNWLETVNGKNTDQSDLETGGLKIITTLDPQIQASAQSHINTYVPAKSSMTAVLPVLDPHTGDILAMATSKKFGTKSGETEQPVFTKQTAFGASTYKLFPLLVALSTGVPNDWKLTTAGSTGTWAPKNCAVSQPVSNGDENVFYSPTENLASATAKSSNTYFVGLADSLLDCNLQPIVDMATKLGITGLNAQETAGLTVGQAIVQQQRAQQLVLGSIPTSPLELAGAYATVANGGVYNVPRPVLTISRCTSAATTHCSARNSQRVDVKRSTPVRVLAPQVAAQAAQLLTGDTRYPGTSASTFSNWYGLNPSVVAGKTGTVASNQSGKNAAVWFAGMTPDLVATAAIINFDNTSVPSRGLTGQGIGTAYGDFAAKVWLSALQPTLLHKTWTWPDPTVVGQQQVPDLLGMSLADARTALSQYRMKLVEFGGHSVLGLCPSNEPYDTIGYYGPQRADNGDTITVCVSNGVPQWTPPPPPHTKTPTGSHGPGNGGGSGGGASPPGNGNGPGGGGPGHGHGPG